MQQRVGDMPNRNLKPNELEQANTVLNEIRNRIASLAGGDEELYFAYRRKIQKELSYDERGKPGHRKALKAYKLGEQGGNCAICKKPLPEKYAVLDRLNGMSGYTKENTRLIHADCDITTQAGRGYR
jgi:hypothetical protein